MPSWINAIKDRADVDICRSQKLIENKKIEWDRYCIHVNQFELEKYLPML